MWEDGPEAKHLKNKPPLPDGMNAFTIALKTRAWNSRAKPDPNWVQQI